MPGRKPIYVTDMGECMPRLALSDARRKYHWQVVPYETAEFSGRMLIAGPETQAPQVSLPLRASGWHRIHLGLWSNWTDDMARVRLTRDRSFVKVTREGGAGRVCGQLQHRRTLLEDCGPDRPGSGSGPADGRRVLAGLHRLRQAEPLDDEELAALHADRAQPKAGG